MQFLSGVGFIFRLRFLMTQLHSGLMNALTRRGLIETTMRGPRIQLRNLAASSTPTVP
jgi:hypothetical protein